MSLLSVKYLEWRVAVRKILVVEQEQHRAGS